MAYNNKKEQGYSLTTSYAPGGNLTDRGYPDSKSGDDSGLTGIKYGKKMSSFQKTGGGGGNGYGYGYGSGVTTTTTNNNGDAWSKLLASYGRNDYSDYLAQMRAAAQAAYDRGMETLNNAYNSQLSSLASNLAETKNQLLNQYNRSKKSINDDAESSLKQAYINRMLSEKNLGQQMSARGLSGGATETTLAGMLNNYGNARNNINTTTNNNLSQLEGNYSDNLSQAIQAYNSAVANANLQKAQQEISLENMLAGNQISALGDYQSLMASENDRYLDLLKTAIAHGADFNFTPSEANNAVQAMAYSQAAPLTAGTQTNYAAWQNFLNNQGSGQSANPMAVANQAANNNYLAAILKQLAA